MTRFRIHSYLFLFFILISCEKTPKQEETTHKSYNEIYNLFDTSEDEELRVFYGTKFLEKAKANESKQLIIAGYRILSLAHTDDNALKYCDSIIYLTESNSNKNYPAIAYERKGDYYYNKRVYKRALDNYLLFLKYAKEHNVAADVSRGNYIIGVLKRRIGDTEEALKLYQENLLYNIENRDSINNDITYLRSIMALANVFNDMEEVDSASFYNKFGLDEANKLNKVELANHFSLNQGITLYHDNKFFEAIDRFEKYNPYFENLNDLDKLLFSYYYAGESYLAINNKKKAISYFRKVDSIFQMTQSLFPITRKAYIRLNNYYETEGDDKNRIIFLTRLLEVDSIIKSEQIYLSSGIVNEFDLPKLKEEQKELLIKLEHEADRYRNTYILLSIVILFLLLGFGFQYRKRKLYKKRFHEILNDKETIKRKKSATSTNEQLNVPQDIVDSILSGLKIFEEKEAFTSNKITLNSLAKELNTNPNYLSKVVNYHKKGSFSNYLNNLRIDYTIEQLKTNPLYKKYTIKAISSEVGFNNVQSFSKAFRNSKGINPSYFMKELNKIN